MTVLNQWTEVMDPAIEVTIGIVIIIASLIMAISLTIYCIANDEWQVFIIAFFCYLVAAVSICVVISDSKNPVVTYEYQKVMLTDMKASDLFEEWEFVEQEGKIVTIRRIVEEGD